MTATEVRRCPTCKKPLVKGEREGPAKFARRRFDSPLCASKASGWGRWKFTEKAT